MNAGMFGMAGGQVNGVFPKILGIAGKNQSPSPSAQYITSATAAVGTSLSNTVYPINTRTKAISINGKGALKFLAIGDVGANSPNYSVEIWIDGLKIHQASWVHGANAGYGPVLIGAGDPRVFLEFLPFSSSLEVFVIVGGGSGGTYVSYLADIYQ